LQSGVERDRDLRGLRSQVLRRGELAPLDRPPRLVVQAQRLHQRSIPWLLLAGGGALVAGQPHAAAGLMQFDPGNDWQQCAAIVYGAAQRAAERLGVTLRRPEAIDPLARCRVVLISDAVLGSWSTRQLRALHDCDPWISRDRVIQILVGFRVRLRPCGLAPLRNLLLESDLDPAVVEDLEPLPPVGYRGRVDGVDFCIGGDALLRRLGLKPPESLPLAAGLDRLYLVQDLGQGRRVLAAADFELRLPRRVVRLFRRLRAMDCQIRVVCGWDTGLAQVASRRLGIPQEAVLMADSMAARVDLLQQLRRTSRAPVAFLGYAFSDAAALAAADVAIALDDGIVPFTSLLADLVIPSERLDRLADCLALARRARRLNRTNLALVAGPHLLALVLNLLRPLNPLVSILLTDLPLLAAELQTLVLLQEPTRHRA
jgi:soluble P-type ATPase